MAEPLAAQILMTVKTIGSVPIAYLVSRLGSTRSDVDERIVALEKSGVVRRVDDSVEFVGQGSGKGKPPAASAAE